MNTLRRRPSGNIPEGDRGTRWPGAAGDDGFRVARAPDRVTAYRPRWQRRLSADGRVLLRLRPLCRDRVGHAGVTSAVAPPVYRSGGEHRRLGRLHRHHLELSTRVPRRKPAFSRHGLAATAIFPGAVSWLRRVGCVNSVLPVNRLVVKTPCFWTDLQPR